MIPHYPSVNVLFDLLHAGKTTSTAIVSELVARADAMAYLNAYITLDAEAALVRAQELDEMRNQVIFLVHCMESRWWPKVVTELLVLSVRLQEEFIHRQTREAYPQLRG